ncbi:MAG: HlyD family type I secretion periplasmic adaptor subunit [Pirellulaceae bacterium]
MIGPTETSVQADAEMSPPAAPEARLLIEQTSLPTWKWIGLSILGALLLAVVWLFVAQVGVVIYASGAVVGGDRALIVQVPADGLVSRILVKENMEVRRGDVIAELDDVAEKIDAQKVLDSLSAAEIEAHVLRSLIGIGQEMPAPASTNNAQMELARQRISAMRLAFETELEKADQQIDAGEAAIAEAQAQNVKLRTIEPLIAERLKMRKTLLDKGFGSKASYLELEELLASNRNDQHVLAAILDRLRSERDQLKSSRQLIENQTHARWENELAAARATINIYSSELATAQIKVRRTVITAPQNGVIIDVVSATRGSVVQKGQTVARIVPAVRDFAFEAWIENADAPYVSSGQRAEVDLSAFPALLHGSIIGVVDSVAPEATAQAAGEQLFRLRIKLGKTFKREGMKAGMAGTARVLVGRRTVFEYFFLSSRDPLKMPLQEK